MPDLLTKRVRELLGDVFDKIGTTAIQGEVLCENQEVSRDDLRRKVQTVIDNTHILTELLK